MGDAEKIAEDSQRINLKRRLDKRAAVDRQKQLQATSAAKESLNGSSSFVIKGLKTRTAPGPEAPFDAFGGLSLSQKAYHVVQDDYDWDWLENLKTEPQYRAGGYSPAEFYSRALCEAFSGLGVMIGQESSGSGPALSTVSAVHAGTGAKEVKMEDPF